MIVLQPHQLHAALTQKTAKPNTSMALIYCVDNKFIAETIDHFQKLGFDAIVLFVQTQDQVIDAEGVIYVQLQLDDPQTYLSYLIPRLEGLEKRWIYWGYNAEFWIYPYFETRTVSDLINFLNEERREHCFSMMIDAFAWRQYIDPFDFHINEIGFDATNYFFEPATPEEFPDADLKVIKRIAHIYGGLRWRTMEHLPKKLHSLSRTPFLKIRKDMRINDDQIFEDPELHTHSGDFHRSVSGAVVSLRLMLDLLHNPESRHMTEKFNWAGAEKFNWTSPQFLRLGIIETGQWF